MLKSPDKDYLQYPSPLKCSPYSKLVFHYLLIPFYTELPILNFEKSHLKCYLILNFWKSVWNTVLFTICGLRCCFTLSTLPQVINNILYYLILFSYIIFWLKRLSVLWISSISCHYIFFIIDSLPLYLDLWFFCCLYVLYLIYIMFVLPLSSAILIDEWRSIKRWWISPNLINRILKQVCVFICNFYM